MTDHTLGQAIVQATCNPELRDAAIDIGELEIDAFLDEGVLREIPLLKSILACRKTWASIADQLFLRKVYSFMVASPKFTKEEIEAFTVDHWRGENAQRLASAVVLLIDRLDDLEKPAMLARVFAALVRKNINYDTFRRLAAGIDNATIQDLQAFIGDQRIQGDTAEPFPWGLVRSGFARLKVKDIKFGTPPEMEAVVSDLGLLFRKCVHYDF